jgi:hypothetical protein
MEAEIDDEYIIANCLLLISLCGKQHYPRLAENDLLYNDYVDALLI